jgi:RNA polymerase sigma factor (sigma-70 family)
MVNSPFVADYNHNYDLQLIEQIKHGSQKALEELLQKHRHYIYNIAVKMCLSPFDAEDITQEVLIKIVNNIASFRAESTFRTWLYRITCNHFLTMKRKWLEDVITTFDAYGDELDGMKDTRLSAYEELEMQEIVEDAKIGCMSGMLLCLDREQRLVYVLGEIFGIDHSLGSEILQISKDNFRQRLARARRDLYNFMNNKCGLVNSNNPCRCAHKTKSFIQAGWVDEKTRKFNSQYVRRIQDAAPQKSADLCELTEIRYAELYQFEYLFSPIVRT